MTNKELLERLTIDIILPREIEVEISDLVEALSNNE